MSDTRRPWYFSLLAAVSASLACSMAGVKQVAAVDAAALIKVPGTLLIDVRTPEEYEAGHLEGARLMPLNELEEKLGSLVESKSTPVVVYCRSGRRSGMGGAIMKDKGWTDVRNLAGGIIAWKAAGLPVVQDK